MPSDLLIRQISDDAKTRLKRRAARNGRSMTAEARGILEATLAGEPAEPHADRAEGRWTRIARRLDGLGVDLWPHIQELREVQAKPALFDDSDT